MPTFGKASREKLEPVHSDLVRLMWSVIKDIDIKIIWGFRDKAKQDEFYSSGASQKQWPDSCHNVLPCKAVDIAPWPELYGRNRREKNASPINFALIAGIVLTHAKALGLEVRWGGDWDRDLTTSDTNFCDFGHFELVN